MDLDEEKRFTYCGTDVIDGRLRLLFAPDRLGTNISSCLDRDVLLKALNDAPAPDGASMSYAARLGIRGDFDAKIETTRARIAELVARPDIKLNPNFEENFSKLLAESKVKKNGLNRDWQEQFGGWTQKYFEGLASGLEWQKFEDDELLQEGFNEGVEKGEVVFRIVDKLQQGSYNECVIEDGVLYLQVSIPSPFVAASCGLSVCWGLANVMMDRLRRRLGGRIFLTWPRSWLISCKLDTCTLKLLNS